MGHLSHLWAGFGGGLCLCVGVGDAPAGILAVQRTPDQEEAEQEAEEAAERPAGAAGEEEEDDEEDVELEFSDTMSQKSQFTEMCSMPDIEVWGGKQGGRPLIYGWQSLVMSRSHTVYSAHVAYYFLFLFICLFCGQLYLAFCAFDVQKKLTNFVEHLFRVLRRFF